jgi:pyruvyltransferase
MLDRTSDIINIICGNRNEVELYFWSPNDNSRENFGDYLSKIIIEKVAEVLNVDVNTKKINRYKIFAHSHQLLAIGSIMHAAKNSATIWGSGINGKVLNYDLYPTNLDVRMVRGPLTRNILISKGISCPEIYGDPALLLSDFFKAGKVKKKYEYILIPNKNEVALFESFSNCVSPLEDWKFIVNKILQSKLVISSSLHGVIVAEPYGIPARHFMSYSEPIFKYEDYYRGTGRDNFRFAQSVNEAIELGGEPSPDINKLKTLMYKSFPKDIWQ